MQVIVAAQTYFSLQVLNLILAPLQLQWRKAVEVLFFFFSFGSLKSLDAATDRRKAWRPDEEKRIYGSEPAL